MVFGTFYINDLGEGEVVTCPKSHCGDGVGNLESPCDINSLSWLLFPALSYSFHLASSPSSPGLGQFCQELSIGFSLGCMRVLIPTPDK